MFGPPARNELMAIDVFKASFPQIASLESSIEAAAKKETAE